MTSEIMRFGSCSKRTFSPLNYKVNYSLFSPGDFMVLFLKIQILDSDFHFRLECRRTWKTFVSPRKTQTYKKSHFPKGLTKIGQRKSYWTEFQRNEPFTDKGRVRTASTPGKSSWSKYGKTILETPDGEAEISWASGGSGG